MSKCMNWDHVVAFLAVTFVAASANATIVNPNPVDFAADDGSSLFSPLDPVLSVEVFDFFPLGSTFGFYFEGADVTNPANLITIFDPGDATGDLANIDFAAGQVVDVDVPAIQSVFAGSGNIGFFLSIPDILPQPLFSQASLNPFGDVAATFRSLLDPTDYIIGFEAPFEGPVLSFHFLSGIDSTIPEPSTLLLIGVGLLGLRATRARRRER
jgi:hypothetical protein